MDLFEEKAIKPMLIKDMMEPFDSPDYIYELKLDGIRCIAYLDQTGTDLRNKRNVLLLPKFPELNNIHQFVKDRCILDGELVILKKGVPDFFELQRRTLMSDRFKIQLSSSQFPASFVAYDILYLHNRQLTDLPLLERKKLLENVINENASLAVSRYIPEQGIELFHLAKQQNLEGVIAKVKDSKYYFDKRTNDWIKFKFLADKDFVVCGYIPKEKGMTSIILGQYRQSELLYKGHVTLGVHSNFAAEYHCRKSHASPFRLTPSGNEEAIWLEPTLVCVVQYMPNEKGTLRQPVLKGFRDDKSPLECKEDSPDL
ncbi:MAG: dependent ligase [Lachnospiraceae bacterium]|jgi:DNA ligase D-like protein (predicted ligase)|nr:dependent ligase [Lachnospiraceae bacterium]